MKTLKELQSIIGGQLVENFSFNINEKKSFYKIQLTEQPSIETVKLALDNKLEFRVEILNKKDQKGNMIQSLVFSTYPINGRSHEWVEE